MAFMDCEKLLDGFRPSFEFVPPKAITEEELASRVEHIRRESIVAEHDVTLVVTNNAHSFNTANKYLRYLCDWNREGVLIIPNDTSKGMHLYSFFTQSVILPPSWGEAVGVEKIYQVGALGREYSGREVDSIEQLVKAVVKDLADMGYGTASIGYITDSKSVGILNAIKAEMPKAKFGDESHVILEMQRLRSPAEVDLIRASVQLQEIGFEAACHVCRPGVTDWEMYAAFTYAQLARGGENADGYQIGVNKWGTHCGKAYGHIIESGDLINFYVSGISYRGYTGQIARMIAVGDITAKQEEALEVCVESLREAEKVLAPGARLCDVNKAGFQPFIKRGLVKDDITKTMPYNWASNDDFTPVEIPIQYIPDPGLEKYGRKLMHIYPPVAGPHNPNLGHSVGMHGNPVKFNVTSHNTDICRPGLTIVLHPQWLVPMECGSNIGNCYAITEDGFENLSCHTPVEAVRIKA